MKTAAALAGLALCSAGLVWALPGAYRTLPLLAPDSTTYLAWDVMRPVAYPALLAAIGLASPHLGAVGPLQLALFLSSAVWMSLSFARAVKAPLVALALGALVMLHPQLVSYTFTVLAESLLAALVMAHLAATIHLLSRPTLAWSATSALLLAAAILTKPVATAFIAGVPVLVATLSRTAGRGRVYGVWLATFAAPILLASAVNVGRAGVFSPQAIGGFALLGVTGTFMSDDTPVAPPTLKIALLQRLRPLRDELERIDGVDLYYFYSSTAYHAALEQSRAVIQQHLRHEYPNDTDEQLFVRLNATAETIARDTIQYAPAAYRRHLLAHLYGLWLMPLVQNSARADDVQQRVRDVEPQAPTLTKEPIMFRFVPAAVYWPFKTLLALVLASSFVVLLMWLRQPHRPLWAIGAYASVLLHAYFLATAAAQTGLPRYALTVWPLSILVLSTFACGALNWLRPRRIADTATIAVNMKAGSKGSRY